ncbi:coniferyl-aldehyde dehydrogenase [Sphingomonas sp. PP-CE-3A-406]|uniref:coniferyl aldehyde dehydrogenase n=1 Tax=Sphingomonas sp. PP-CE-3A-406 TaxID=2135659 RepID=UPI000EF9E630|nr:coniferyl aldehyde dehydrogenase [Sphingomonas sp. PP-CE-3A-406]RMB52368.1 coniferyl-aldehyde dehydrogenase [Sphingomonas sp. PP-CE-3A-406]
MTPEVQALRTAFDRQHRASRDEVAASAPIRQALLDSLHGLLIEGRAALVEAISDDFGGRSKTETDILEIVPLITAIGHSRARLKTWMRDSPRRVDLSLQPGTAWVRYEPLGVIGVIAPWNYPLFLTLGPAIDALAAGNRVIVKPSEASPAFAALLARLVADRFDADRLTVVQGGVAVSQALSGLPLDHLVFTGSTEVGRHILRAAADHLTPVTLELGGKSPAIVAPDFAIDRAAKSIAFGRYLNAGQTCVAPDYALVPAASARRFADGVLSAAVHRYRTIERNGDYSNIIDARHHQRLTDAIEEARRGGAEILTHPAPAPTGHRIAPTVVLGAPDDCTLMREEIFGPVLPVKPYDTLDAALAFVRARPRPLALYCFADGAATQRRILNGATSGGVTINGTLLHVAQHSLPFGGIGASGMGAYHGRDGFFRFSHARAVHKAGPINMFERIGPPWGTAARLTMRLVAGLKPLGDGR